MGLEFRKVSGRIANGSRLVVPGQITTGQKVFPNSFSQKSAPPDPKLPETTLLPIPTPNPSVTPTPPISQTPTLTPTPTTTPQPTPTTTPQPTPTPSMTQTLTPTLTPSSTPNTQIINPIIVNSETYISVGSNEYLEFNQ